jgi:diadenylate cyclase
VLQYVQDIYTSFSPKDAVDILIVAMGIYWLLLLIRGTRAFQMLVGLFLVVAVLVVSQYFQLFTTQWVLDNFLGSFAILIVVIFQHDIRRALAKVGRGVFFPQMGRGEETQVLEEVVRAAQSCANKRIGALIVLERETGLENYVEGGQPLDAKIYRDLLVSIFMPGSPLHDGAVIVQGGRIIAAGCLLPLTRNPDVDRSLGTRHRAAIGLTEETDAVVVVVSEQTGNMSVVEGGVIEIAADAGALRSLLVHALGRRSKELGKPAEEAAPELGAGGLKTAGAQATSDREGS